MLEEAVRNSVIWSMRSKSGRNSTNHEDSDINETRERDESQIRAFLTRFKIELNSLMDSNLSYSNNNSSKLEMDTLCLSKSETGCFSDPSNSVPVIMINGRHSGLYEIHRERSDGMLRGRLNCHKPRRSKSIGAVVINETSTRLNGDSSDNDDGYRSLSRGSFRSNLMQKLSDIKTRLLDLIDEIDQSIETQLTTDQADAYRRRKVALVAKLDSLIESCLDTLHGSASNLIENLLEDDLVSEMADNSEQRTNNTSYDTSSQDSSTNPLGPIVRNSSEVNLYSDGYEDQIQVIDYNFKRRSSDNSALSRGRNQSKSLAKSTTANVKVAPKSIDISNLLPSARKPIDFGAMMRDYENKKNDAMMSVKDERRLTSRESKVAQHHVISSSSASTYSEQSSSSFL